MKSTAYMILADSDQMEEVTRDIAVMYLTRWRAMRFRVTVSRRSDGVRAYHCLGTNDTVLVH